MMAGYRREPVDLGACESRARRGPCFVCAIVAGKPDYRHEVVYEDEHHIAFLDRWPTVLAKCLVAPKAHVERVVGDLDGAEFHRLMGVVRLVALAVEDVVAPERTYLLSLGSQQGNAHIHWHVAGLPPGVPYDEQQFHALMAENGVIRQTTPDEQRLGRLIRQAVLARAGGGRAGASRGGQTGLYGEGGSQVSG